MRLRRRLSLRRFLKLRSHPSQRPKRHRRLLLEGLEDRSLLAAFTPGNLVVYRVGAGSAGLTNAATQVFLDEYNPADVHAGPVQSIALPTSAAGSQHALLASGTAISDGLMTLSSDGRFLVLTGYDAPTPPPPPNIASTVSSAVNRVIGRVDASGNVDTSTAITDGFSGGNVRGVASLDGAGFWVAGSGAGGGVRYQTFGVDGTSTLVSNTVTSTRGLAIFDGQLYVSANSGSPPFRLATVGSGTPTATGQTMTKLPGIPNGSNFPGEPHQFFLADLSSSVPGVDTLYVADDGGGLRKFALVSGNWILNQTLPTTIRGLTGMVNGTQVTMYATTNESHDNDLIQIVDVGGYNAPFSGTTTTINSGAPNQAMRGVAFVPLNIIVPDPIINGNENNNTIELSRSGDNVVVEVDGSEVLNQPLVDTDSLTINGLGGNDTLIVHFSEGNPIPGGGVQFAGGDPISGFGDSLVLDRGGSTGLFDTITHTFTSNSDGSVSLDPDGPGGVPASTIEYAGLEPVSDNLDAAHRIFTYNGGAEAIVLSDIADSGGKQMRIDSTLGEGVDFANPSDSLTLNAGTGDDSMTVLSVDNALPAGIAINGDAGNDTIHLDGDIHLASGRNLNIDLADDAAVGDNDSIDVGAGANVTSSGTGRIDFVASGFIALNSAASLETENGGIALAANQQATPTPGTFNGITLLNSALVRTTGTGPIVLEGRAGVTGHYGTLLSDFARIQSTAAGVNAGGITLVGIAGAGSNFASGIELFAASNYPKIESLDGPIRLTGTGGGSAGGTNNRGVVIFQGEINATGSAMVEINGTGGLGTDAHGVFLGLGAIDVHDGSVQVTGAVAGSTGFGIHNFGSGNATTVTGSADVAYIADSIHLDSGIAAGASTVTLRPNTMGVAIELGGGDAAGTLGLLDVELDQISASTLKIGDANTGPITVSAAIDRPAPTAVQLTSGDEIAFSTGSIDTGNGDLTLSPGSSSSVGVASFDNDVMVGAANIVAFAGGTDLTIVVNGPGADTQYHRLAVLGQVDLSGVSLAVSGLYAPTPTDSFVIVANDLNDPIVGTFSSLPSGTLVNVNGIDKKIIYTGGDGNDVSLVPTVDATCNGIDDDADGFVDEDFVPTLTATSASACVGGSVVTIPQADWGDAPTAGQSGFAASYPTLAADNGAAHTATGPRLGSNRDVEFDGQLDVSATGDDANGLPGDEDGVVFVGALTVGASPSVQIELQNAGSSNRLDAWIDFNQDGVWDDSALSVERIFTGQALVAGGNLLSFNIPPGASIGNTYARFRVSSAGNLAPGGVALDGEVEDYQVTIQAAVVDPGTTSVEVSGGILLVADVGGGNSNDALILTRQGANLRITDPNNTLAAGSGVSQVDPRTVEVPLASIAGNIQIDTFGGDDTVAIDYTGGDPLPPSGIVFDGGAGFDSLGIKGTLTQNLVYAPTTTSPDPSDKSGGVTIDGANVQFLNLEPIDVQGMLVASIVPPLPGADDVLTIANGFSLTPAFAPVGTIAALVVSGFSGPAGIESVAFWNNAAVAIDASANGGDDTVTIASADNAHGNTNLTVLTGDGADAIEIDGIAAFSGSIHLSSQQINFNTPAARLVADTVLLAAGSGSIDGSNAGLDVVAIDLMATAGAGIDVDTTVGTIAAAITGAGNIVIEETTGLTAVDLDTGAGRVTLTAGDAVADGDADLDVVASEFLLVVAAGGGIGSLINPLQTSVSELDVTNVGGGGIFVSNSGALQLADLGGPNALAVSGGGGGGEIRASSPLTFAANASTTGGITYTANDSAAAGDDITFAAGVTLVEDSTAHLIFNAGDDMTVPAVVTISPATTLTINLDGISGPDADPGIGSTLDSLGLLAAGGTIAITGGGDADTLRVARLSAAGSATIDGGAGNDTVVLSDGAILATAGAVGNVDGIGRPVTVIAGSGTDTLHVVDEASSAPNSVFIDETSMEGITTATGTDFTFGGVEHLHVTGSAAADTLEANLDASALITVTVNGSGGGDQFFLDLNASDDSTNAVTGLTSVTLHGDDPTNSHGVDDGADIFGNTPANAPPPDPPAALPAPIFAGSQRKIRPSTTTSISVNGGLANIAPFDPISFNHIAGNTAGDTINLDLTDRRASPGPADTSIVAVSTVSGLASLTGFVSISFAGEEAINLCDQGLLTRTQMGDLYVRMTEGSDIVQFSKTSTPNLFRARLNNQFIDLAATRKIVVYGRGSSDYLQMTNATLAGNLPLAAEFYGEGGDDYLVGYTGDDLLVGGLGNDRLLAGDGNNELWGDKLGEQSLLAGGNDQLSSGNGIDAAYGGGGNDLINLGGNHDFAFGGAGNDQVDGMAGDDRLFGGDGDDTINGSAGNDLIAGNAGKDRLYGKSGHDVVIGGDAADIINGDEGNDLLFDGNVTYDDAGNPPAGNDASTVSDDANSLAMAALLADWAADFAVNAAFLAVGHDAFLDALSGGIGSDTAYRKKVDPNKDSILAVEADLP